MVFCGNKEYDFVLYALLWEHNNLVFTEGFRTIHNVYVCGSISGEIIQCIYLSLVHVCKVI